MDNDEATTRCNNSPNSEADRVTRSQAGHTRTSAPTHTWALHQQAASAEVADRAQQLGHPRRVADVAIVANGVVPSGHGRGHRGADRAVQRRVTAHLPTKQRHTPQAKPPIKHHAQRPHRVPLSECRGDSEFPQAAMCRGVRGSATNTTAPSQWATLSR